VSGSLQVARAALRNRALRATLVAFVFFSVAEWTRWVALLVFGFDRGGAAGSGLIAVIQLVPAAILTPFTSSLADRFHRPRVLLAGYLVAAFGTAAGGIAIVVDAPFVVVVILSALGGVTLIRPTQASLLPRLVSTPAELTAANAIVSFVVGGSILAGPALAAALMAVWSPGATLIVAGALLAVGALTIAFVYRGSVKATGPGEPVDLLGGFRQVARNPGAGLVLLLLGLQAITWGAVDVLIVGLAIDQLDLGRSGAGLLAAAVGVGGLMGGAATISLAGRSRLTPGFAFGVALWGIPLVAIAIVLAPVPVIAFLAIAGVGYAFMDVSGRTLLQRAVDERTLGRVFGLLEAGLWRVGDRFGDRPDSAGRTHAPVDVRRARPRAPARDGAELESAAADRGAGVGALARARAAALDRHLRAAARARPRAPGALHARGGRAGGPDVHPSGRAGRPLLRDCGRRGPRDGRRPGDRKARARRVRGRDRAAPRRPATGVGHRVHRHEAALAGSRAVPGGGHGFERGGGGGARRHRAAAG
jgi:MFS family permease